MGADRRNARTGVSVMDKDQKIVLFSLSLAATMVAVWYFSRKPASVSAGSPNPDADVSATDSSGSPFTFNLPPVNIPPITTPNFGSTSSNTSPQGSTCCRNCGDSSTVSASPSPGSLISPVSPQIAQNTQSGLATQPNINHSTIFEPLLEGNDGALPRPNPVLWVQDKNYRLAYVLSWNDNVKNANDMCWRSGSGGSAGGYVCKIGPLNLSLANNPDLTAIESATSGTASAILKSSPGDPLYTAMMQSMSVYLNQFGDTGSNSGKNLPTIGSNLAPLG